jgi:UDP-3-O-[3-hydroxymyristoyl] glucosamine N-acyltransferase
MKIEPAQRLKDIAAIIGVEYDGPPEHLVSGLNEIHKVEKGDIVFVDHPKYYDKALGSDATTILINKKVPCPAGKGLLFSDDPFSDYNRLVKHFYKVEFSAQPISPSAQIGKDTVIMPGVFIGNQVKIGTGCVIHPNVTIYDHTIIGNNVVIHANTVLGADAFYFKKRPEKFDKLISCGRVVIEDEVEIGAGCTIDKGVSGDTVIGYGSKLDNQIQVAHDTVIGKMCLIAAHSAIAGATIIEDNVTIWGQVGISSGLVVGKGAVILAQSGVDKSLPGGKRYFGTPAENALDKMKDMALVRLLRAERDKK